MKVNITPEKFIAEIRESRNMAILETRIKAKLKILTYFEKQRKTKRNLTIKNDLVALMSSLK